MHAAVAETLRADLLHLIRVNFLYRDDPRPRERRVAELLWRYVQAMERRASRGGDPRLAEFLAIGRWVALAFLEPASAAQASADALRQAGDAPAAALVRLGGLTSAIEMPLAREQTPGRLAGNGQSGRFPVRPDAADQGKPRDRRSRQPGLPRSADAAVADAAERSGGRRRGGR